MSRDIKFRAWSESMKIMYKPFNLLQYMILKESEQEKICPCTGNIILMQYTGLKDKNEVEIYENDILDHYATSGAVIFENGMFCLNMSAKVNFGHRQPLCYIDVSQSEIIGNVWENKELLNDSK